MSNIQTNQELRMENVLSFRKKMNTDMINSEMERINKFLSDNHLVKTAPMVTATYSVEQVGMEQLMDIEVLIALDKSFTPPEGCIVKPIFFLTNAIKIEHIGDVANLQETANILLKYIYEQGLTQITSGYNVTIDEKDNLVVAENMTVEIYVGISPNIL